MPDAISLQNQHAELTLLGRVLGFLASSPVPKDHSTEVADALEYCEKIEQEVPLEGKRPSFKQWKLAGPLVHQLRSQLLGTVSPAPKLELPKVVQ